MKLLLGIDLGTSYFKIGLFSEAGEIKGLGRVPVNRVSPAPGWSEMAVEEFWRALRLGLTEALQQAKADAKDIVGVSYSSQASTFLLLDAQDEPLTPLIVWTDSRGIVTPEYAAFRQRIRFKRMLVSEIFQRKPLRRSGAGCKRMHLISGGALAGFTISDYFTFALTGQAVGDASTVAFLGVFDLNREVWWDEALNCFRIEKEKLARPLRPGSLAGVTNEKAAQRLGLSSGVPVAVGALDHHAAAIGSGLERLADASISTGTVLAALVLVNRSEPYAECYHGRHVDGRRLWRLAFDQNGAVQLEVYQRNHAPDQSIENLLTLAAAVPIGAQAKSVGDHGMAVRGILERVARTHRTLLRNVVGAKTGLGAVRSVVATGGGARSPLWLQINADMLNVPVITPASSERACLGAAAFAAVAAGLYSSIQDATAIMVRPDRVYEPKPESVRRYESEG